MRFSAYITGPLGKISQRRASLPSKKFPDARIIRMDPEEQFRVMFDNDWDTPCTVTYEYDDDPAQVFTIRDIARGDIVVSPETFVYTFTETGDGRPLVIRTETPAGQCCMTFVLTNNTYNSDGTAVQLGDEEADNIIGIATRREDDPDLHTRRDT